MTQLEVVNLVAADIREGHGGWMVTANLDHLRRMHDDRQLRQLVRQCDMVVADGMPLVWTSRIAGSPLPERIAGSDLIYTLSERAADENRSIFLVGGSPGAPQTAAARLRSAYPGLQIAGILCPPLGFEHDPEQIRQIADAIAESRPGIVFVALGFPKQDQLIVDLRAQGPAAWYVGVGASIDFVAGFVQRSPVWMQRAGIEWLHRLTRDPGRLAKRYLVHGLPFAARLLAWAARERIRRRAPNDSVVG